MFAGIRTYEVTDVEELSELVREEFLPIVETVPGFVAYYVVDGGNGRVSSITICDEEAGVRESTARAAAWVEERVAELIEAGPAVIVGPISAEARRLELAA